MEGNGLYDASQPKGNYTSEIFKHQDIEVICSGNHELYKTYTAEVEYRVTAPNFKGRYLATNIDIFNSDSGRFVPLAPRYRKFTTKNQGIRILAFGFLFDFTENANNTIVRPVEETIQERWFQEAIRDREVDLFLVIGHVPIRSKEYKDIYTAIREVQWDTPIQFFGGHSHIRDFARYDSKSSALESGRYLETIGFMSVDGIKKAGGPFSTTANGVSTSRRYIDHNLLSFYHHTGLNHSTFPTESGRNLSGYIADARRALQLDRLLGCAPQDYWLNRARFSGNHSVLTWLQNNVLPGLLQSYSSDDGASQMIVNTGAVRFDIFNGPFTVDDLFILSPFTSGFKYLKDVPYQKTKQLLPLLNGHGPNSMGESPFLHDLTPRTRQQQQAPLSVKKNHRISRDGDQSVLAMFKSDPLSPPRLEPGYTTHDDDGDDGDDTLHSPIAFYNVPNCIETTISPRSPSSSNQDDGDDVVDDQLSTSEPDTVTLVFLEYIQPWILLALTFLGQEYTSKDVLDYADGRSFTALLSDWIVRNWDRHCLSL